LGPTEFSET